MFDSVRIRLTAWYVGVLALILVVFSFTVYIFEARSLYERLDASLRSTLDNIARALQEQAAATNLREDDALSAVTELYLPNRSFAIFDEAGHQLLERTTEEQTHIRLPSFDLNSVTSMTFYSLPETNSESDDSCRGVVQRIQTARRSYLVLVNQSLEPVGDQLDSLQNIFSIVVPLSLVLAGFGGWFLAGRSLEPVGIMAQRAQHISLENLDQRLPVANPRDELGHLAITFNELLSRLSNSFAQQRQFMTDASHELRTPLSAIRTVSAVILQRENREPAEYREALTIVEQQARRLTRIVEDMFVLARADAGHPTLQISSFYLDELLVETVRAAALLASQKDLQLEVPLFSEAPLHGDEGLVRQMIWNLLDNAVKYTPRGGKIRIALDNQDSMYVMAIHDTGIGIPPEFQAHIFERFFRVDQARSRQKDGDEGGAGLGLSIALWIAEAHNGRLELQRSDEGGSTFVVFLPRA